MDLSASLSTQDRHQRLVDSITDALPVDAVMLMRHEAGVLRPLAQHGLSRDALGRHFPLASHPRLELVAAAEHPTIFPHDSELPDPFDGLVDGVPILTGQIHACVGCPLRAEGQLEGILTLDALEPHALAEISPSFFAALAALAGASLRTSLLIEALEETSRHQDLVASDQVRASRERYGASLIGDSPELARLREDLGPIGRSDLPVLITGETGAGKEPVVRRLHALSSRADKPLVYVNCAALPESLAETELFGHARGAFTDAREARPGKFQLADGASLFLDEIGELPLSIQPKLLRILQSGELQRVGADGTTHVNARIFAATNRDLRKEVDVGRFRADLLHRLDVCRVHVPALREHPVDVPLLAGHFCERTRRGLGTGPVRLTRDAQRALEVYTWPGNVRELENVISRAVLRAAGGVAPGETIVLEARHLGAEFQAQAGAPGELMVRVPESQATQPPERTGPLRDAVEHFQRECILDALEAHVGVWSRAATELGMHRANFHRLAKRLGIRRPRFERPTS
jgi:anaerobic nitric oxide reductase transcription regulator